MKNQGKGEETWKVRKWVVELCCTVRADSIAERWKFSAIDASDAEGGGGEDEVSSPLIEGSEYISAIDTGDAGSGAGEEDDSSPIEDGDESVSAILIHCSRWLFRSGYKS